MTGGSNCQVRVGVRVRPLTTKEHSQGGKGVVKSSPPSLGIGSRNFTYDKVFDEGVSQSSLYQQVAPSLLDCFLQGYNATIMAYGQTGSGKTFTMGSEAHSADGDSAGLIPRFMSDIFRLLREKKHVSDSKASTSTHASDSSMMASSESTSILVNYNVQASFLEVYGEDVHDLLDKDRNNLPLRDDSKGGVVVSGLKYHDILSAQDALQILKTGTLNRTTAATLMNLTSSRSHAVFTITLTQTTSTGGPTDAITTTATSKFTFVDLAGSERMKKTGAEGERAREGISINVGLLALGNVINALADDERLTKEKKVHVPYRQSKLTRLLQDALGGNSQTLFVACVSPADTNSSETLSTLHYANRARNIKNAPTRNIAGGGELQRLQALNSVFLSELVTAKFGGEAKKLMQTKQVQDYVQTLMLSADQANGSMTKLALPPSSSSMSGSQLTFPVVDPSIVHGSSNYMAEPMSIDENHGSNLMDETILEEVNPEEELAILDQLLELQHHDEEFDKRQKEGQQELKLVQTELEEQEALLLQLRDSLKVYHNMKEKYQALMVEVQHLELEKASLADQLDKAVADPSKGCSTAIKKKLEKVETSLVRARNETRKHQQKYRQAEQQAQKCKALERKISQMKQGKADMVRKQKEAAKKHREYTECKTRELLAMKRKERTAGKKMTKLQTEVQKLKNNFSRQKNHSKKIASKLKETESHLMKLLTMRQRELRNRTLSPRRRQSVRRPLSDNGFIDKSKELESMQFLLNRLVADRTSAAGTRQQYESRVTEYSELMRQLVDAVRALDEIKAKVDAGNAQEIDLGYQVQIVEDLELKLEFITNDLEQLRTKVEALDGTSEVGEDAEDPMESKGRATVASLSAPMARTLLWSFLDRATAAEIDRNASVSNIARKDALISTFDAEVAKLNQTIDVLTNELVERRQIADGHIDPVEKIRSLEEQVASIKKELHQSEAKVATAQEIATQAKKDRSALEFEHADTKEQLSLLQTNVSQDRDGSRVSEEALLTLQSLWRKIGVPVAEREAASQSISSSLEDTCARCVQEATTLEMNTKAEIVTLRNSICMMKHALGSSTDESVVSENLTLFEIRDGLQKRLATIQPEFSGAVERRQGIIKALQMLVHTMKLSKECLSSDLAALLELGTESVVETSEMGSGATNRAVMMRNVEEVLGALVTDSTSDSDIAEEPAEEAHAAPDSLKRSYLDSCERDLSELRLMKSRKTAAIAVARKESRGLIEDMHLTIEDVESVLHTSTNPPPEWWDERTADAVITALVEDDAVFPASISCSTHLDHITTRLRFVAEERRVLSASLTEAIDQAQRSLLSIVGEEAGASEAYASFREALFKLPPLSKEHIQTSIEEINTLTTGVETMIESEFEVLTVMWKDLDTPKDELKKFKSDTETLRSQESWKLVLSTPIEIWMTEASSDAKKAYISLNFQLRKLERTHDQVNRLRSKLDAKSRILSLDAEIRLLSTSLDEFEDQQCNKERLLTKKAGSSNLLREERFRKQMQGKFSMKLKQLSEAVKAWKESDGDNFDMEILSEEVRLLLDNPNNMKNLVDQRTEFMHLRTVPSASAVKRPAPHKGSDSSVKRPRVGEKKRPCSSGSESSNGSTGGQRSGIPPTGKSGARSAKPRRVPPSENPKKRKAAPCKSPTPQERLSSVRKNYSRRTPFQENQSEEKRAPPAGTSKVRETSSKRDTLMPFGHLLGEQSP